MILDKSHWYNIFKVHKGNLRDIVKIYNNEELEKFDKLSQEESKNGLELSSILNRTWSQAPDRLSIHTIPSWSALCSLCSENWVFEDELDTPENNVQILKEALSDLINHCEDYGLKEESLAICMAVEKAREALNSTEKEPVVQSTVISRLNY